MQLFLWGKTNEIFSCDMLKCGVNSSTSREELLSQQSDSYLKLANISHWSHQPGKAVATKPLSDFELSKNAFYFL